MDQSPEDQGHSFDPELKKFEEAFKDYGSLASLSPEQIKSIEEACRFDFDPTPAIHVPELDQWKRDEEKLNADLAELAAARAARRRSDDNKSWLQIGGSVLAIALGSVTIGLAYPAGAPLFFVIAMILAVVGVYLCGATMNRWPLPEPTEKAVWPARIVTLACIAAVIASGIYALRGQGSGVAIPTTPAKTSIQSPTHKKR